jgi:hypothetical protein
MNSSQNLTQTRAGAPPSQTGAFQHIIEQLGATLAYDPSFIQAVANQIIPVLKPLTHGVRADGSFGPVYIIDLQPDHVDDCAIQDLESVSVIDHSDELVFADED